MAQWGLRAKHYAALLVSAALTTVSTAADLPEQKVVATKGLTQVTSDDVRTFNYHVTDREFFSFRQSALGYQKSVEELLNARHAEKSIEAAYADGKDEPELRSIQFARSRATLNAALIIAERKGRERAQQDPAALEKRARELYDTTDTSALLTPLSADIELILFDVMRHDSAEIWKRINQVQAILKKPNADFQALALKYSDEEKSRANRGQIPRVAAASTSEIVSRVLFDQLKPAEVSNVLPHGRGLMMVKLIRVNKPEKRPYEGAIREAALRRAEGEAGQAARDAMEARLLGSAPVVFDDAVLGAQLVVPDPTAIQKWREAEAKRTADPTPPVAESPARQ